MNRFCSESLSAFVLLAVVLAVPAFGAGLPVESTLRPNRTFTGGDRSGRREDPTREAKEMKVKVFVSPVEIEQLATKVLEFYDVTPSFFVGAVSEPTYEELVRRGYEVEVLVADVRAEASKYDAFFHTYAQIRDTWATIAQNHPSICRLDTLGRSANQNLVLAMKISDNPGLSEQEPRICFDFTIHGNENNGTEIAHWALLKILEGYGTDPDITRWVDTREIWLLPIVNPDGLISRSRGNGHGVDMNRNYGYSWDAGGPSVFSETEIQALFHFGRKYPMASWTQYHSGTKRAMWPWGYTTKATMDSVVHQFEMVRYSQLTGYQSCQIARGLYSVHGGSTDWYYGATGAQGYGIEVCNGQPSPPSEIDTVNHANWSAMKEMIERVMWGISGLVTDSVTGAPLEALVTVVPPDWVTYSDSVGFFHKNLHAGTYSVTVSANGYAPKTLSGVVVPADTFVFVNVPLARDTSQPDCAFQVMTNKIKESPSNTNPTNAIWALGKRDNRRFSLGNGGWASYDMGARTPILNGSGSDFYVVEDDADPEACSVSVSNDWNGPWHYIGFGTGTQGYDLATAGMSMARYVRVADDNTGSSGPYAGFDLDAIEAVVVNAPAVVYHAQTIIDSPPGGNGDGRLDPGEYAFLVVALRNAGRAAVSGLSGILRTADANVSVSDSTGFFGDIGPDSVRTNSADRFVVSARSGTPRGHSAEMVVHVSGTDYQDSIRFAVTIGELRSIDPIPDGPRQPPLYWAYDDVDTGYVQHPTYSWVEVRGVGTRLSLSDDQTVRVDLPAGFGPWRYYGQTYTQVSVCGNGWIAPGSTTNSAFENTELPDGSQPPNLAILWTDLYPPAGNGVWHYHDAANHRFIVEYDSVHYYSPRSLWDKAEFIIYDTTIPTPSHDNLILAQFYSGNNVIGTVGIEAPSCTVGITCVYGAARPGCAPIGPGRAIKYTTADPTGIADQRPADEPGGLSIAGSPFRSRTVLRYQVPRTGPVELAVFDRSGRRVRRLFAGEQRAGEHLVGWDGCSDSGERVAAGVYLVRLTTESGPARELAGRAPASVKAVVLR